MASDRATLCALVLIAGAHLVAGYLWIQKWQASKAQQPH